MLDVRRQHTYVYTMTTKKRQPADRPVRLSEEVHRALVGLQLKAVQSGEPRPTLDQVIAKLLKK
jgi:hypothetical protein